ncbi:MAG: hypothetical protein U0R17_01750 [Acidimicrobiia bacterium]
MELLEALRIIRNHIKLLIPLMAVTFIAALIMVSQIQTTYESRGTITLLNSNANSTDNPYLRFDQSLQTTAQVLGDNMSSADTKSKYQDKGLSTNYEVSVPYDPTRTVLLPMLEVKVNAENPEVAKETRDNLLNDIKDELVAKQTEAGAPKESWIQAFSNPDKDVIAQSGSKARTFVIVFVLGAAFSIAIAFVLDGFKRGTKNSRKGETILLSKDKKPENVTKTRNSTSKRNRKAGIAQQDKLPSQKS